MANKPQLKFWQIWNMSFGFLGIQFGFALQNANVSRIFETLGANIEDIPIYWLAAPLTGLIVQPIIGHMSDKTWGRLGRRRPYFLVGAILASLALLVMPNSSIMWIAVGMLWIMDASINISMEPFRAFVGDMLPSQQRTTGFAMQSFFIGTGAVVASALPYILTNWLGFDNTASSGSIPSSVKWSFYIGAIVFISAIIWTILKTKEYPPEQLKSFEKSGEQQFISDSISLIKYEDFNKIGLIAFFIGASLTFLFVLLNYENQLFLITIGLMVFGLMELLAGFMYKIKKQNGFVEVLTDFNIMPKTMVQLAFVQFFSWFALFAMWIYTTSGVTSHIYNMKVNQADFASLQLSYNTIKIDSTKTKESLNILPDMIRLKKMIDKNSEAAINMKLVKFFLTNNKSLEKATLDKMHYIDKQYNDGADWVGICFSVYNGAAAVFAFLLMFIARFTNRKITHSISLLVGGISFVSIFFISNPVLLLIPFLGIGLAWASILAMPYAILTGSLPAQKMGIYMGIFNFFIVIPQILAGSMLGFFVKQLFDGQAIYALFLGGGSLLLASILVVFVNDKD